MKEEMSDHPPKSRTAQALRGQTFPGSRLSCTPNGRHAGQLRQAIASHQQPGKGGFAPLIWSPFLR